MNPVSVIIGLCFIGVQTWLALSRKKGLTLAGKVILQIGLAIGWSILAFAITAYADRLLMQFLIALFGSAFVEVASSLVNHFKIFREDVKDAALPAPSPLLEVPE